MADKDNKQLLGFVAVAVGKQLLGPVAVGKQLLGPVAVDKQLIGPVAVGKQLRGHSHVDVAVHMPVADMDHILDSASAPGPVHALAVHIPEELDTLVHIVQHMLFPQEQVQQQDQKNNIPYLLHHVLKILISVAIRIIPE